MPEMTSACGCYDARQGSRYATQIKSTIKCYKYWAYCFTDHSSNFKRMVLLVVVSGPDTDSLPCQLRPWVQGPRVATPRQPLLMTSGKSRPAFAMHQVSHCIYADLAQHGLQEKCSLIYVLALQHMHDIMCSTFNWPLIIICLLERVNYKLALRALRPHEKFEIQVSTKSFPGPFAVCPSIVILSVDHE